jgi:hypothetical protein
MSHRPCPLTAHSHLLLTQIEVGHGFARIRTIT